MNGMSLRFLVFIWLACMSTLLGIWETINLYNGWHVDWIGVGAALIMSPIGFIGTAIMWRKESLRSYRTALRRQRLNGN
jgi:hypothetical protein